MSSIFGSCRATYRPRLLSDKKSKKDANISKKSINGRTGRCNGREPTQLRPIKMKVGSISHAAGSAYVETDTTKVICGIYGPRQKPRLAFSKQGVLWCDLKFAPFSQPGSRIENRTLLDEETNYSKILADSLSVSIQLDKFPKSMLEAYVCVLQTDSMTSTLCASIIAVSLALSNAGIEMYGLVAACSAGFVQGIPVLEPSHEEKVNSSSTGAVCLAYMPTLNQITHIEQTGIVDVTQTKILVDLCTDGCEKVHSLMRDCLLKHYQMMQASNSCQNLTYTTPSKSIQQNVKRQRVEAI